LLKENSKVMRSEFGELKIKVWDTDKNLAPQLANALLDKLNSIHQSLQAANNLRVLESLKAGRLKLQQTRDNVQLAPLRSTVPVPDGSANIITVLDQLKKYDELIGEYQLTLDTNPAVLVVVEKARASISPDKPKRFMLLVATAVISFLFSFLLALFLERRKRRVL
jgi:capsular polysaccharide biosynthesis protein